MQTIKLETGETLEFDEASHVYRIDGDICPGTHALMERHGIVKPLDQYAAPYAERGKRVHLLTQLHDEGDLDESSIQELDRPYLEAWGRFVNDNCKGWFGIEKLVGSANYWAATVVDRIGNACGRDQVVVNIKTVSKFENIEKHHKAHAVQLAIEAILVGTNEMLAVYMTPEGEYQPKWFTDEAAYNLAASMLQTNGAAHRYMTTRRKRTLTTSPGAPRGMKAV